MTEAVWLTRNEPNRMLRYLRRRWSRRKVRLFVSESLYPLFLDFFLAYPSELAALPRELAYWVEGRENELIAGNALHTFGSLKGESLGFHFDWPRLIWDNDWLDAHRLIERSDATQHSRLVQRQVKELGYR